MAKYIYKSLRGDVGDRSIISRGNAIQSKFIHLVEKLLHVVMLKMDY